MASLRAFLCFSLVLLWLSSCETRVLDPSFSDSKSHSDRAFTTSSSLTEVSKISKKKQEIIEKHFESKKVPNDENGALMESAKEMFKQSVKRQEIIGKFFEPKRVSPGGPDPHHH